MYFVFHKRPLPVLDSTSEPKIETEVNIASDDSDSQEYKIYDIYPEEVIDCDNLEPQKTNGYRPQQDNDNNSGFFNDQQNPSGDAESELFFYWAFKSVESLPSEDQANIRIEINNLIMKARLNSTTNALDDPIGDPIFDPIDD